MSRPGCGPQRLRPPAICWIGRLEEAPARLGGPLVWIARHADLAVGPLPPPEAADLADAAQARREGGGGRLLRRRMLRALVGRLFALHPAAVRFTRDPRGAPGLADLFAFLSTAGCVVDGEAWSAVALSLHSVGVDVEGGSPSDALTCWTLTEAYLKALGAGLAEAPERVHVAHRGDGWRLSLADASRGSGEARQGPLFTAACVTLQDMDGS